MIQVDRVSHGSVDESVGVDEVYVQKEVLVHTVPEETEVWATCRVCYVRINFKANLSLYSSRGTF